MRERARAPKDVWFEEIRAAGFTPVEAGPPLALNDNFYAAFRRIEPDAASPNRPDR